MVLATLGEALPHSAVVFPQVLDGVGSGRIEEQWKFMLSTLSNEIGVRLRISRTKSPAPIQTGLTQTGFSPAALNRFRKFEQCWNRLDGIVFAPGSGHSL